MFKGSQLGLVRSLLVFVVVIIFARSVIAAGSINIAEGEVFVDTTRNPERAALQQVFVKITGTRNSLANEAVRTALRQADRYILSYEYYQENNQRIYKAFFDKAKIEALIRKEKLPIWGATRPDAIVWFAYAENESIEVVAESTVSTLRDAVKRYANERGVPLLLPLMDLDDSINLSETDIWAGYMPVINHASMRYNSDFLISGRIIDIDLFISQQQLRPQSIKKYVERHKLKGMRGFDRDALTLETALFNAEILKVEEQDINTVDVYPQADVPQGAKVALEWSIRREDQLWSGREFAADSDTLIAQFIDIYADILGEKYAILPNKNDIITPILTVSNIQSLQDMVALSQYLNELTVVDSVKLNHVRDNVATFNVSLLGSLVDLSNTITLGNKLTQVNMEQPELVTDSQPQLHFFWQG